MTTSQPLESVWNAIEDTPAQAENMKVRSTLMIVLKARIEAEGLSKAAAAKHFGVTQPRISDLLHGKINRFSIDMLTTAGLRVDLQISQAV